MLIVLAHARITSIEYNITAKVKLNLSFDLGFIIIIDVLCKYNIPKLKKSLFFF